MQESSVDSEPLNSSGFRVTIHEGNVLATEGWNSRWLFRALTRPPPQPPASLVAAVVDGCFINDRPGKGRSLNGDLE